MAWLFDEVNDDVQITDNAALTFPNGDWSFGGWFKLTDNTGSIAQYFISWGAPVTASSCNFYIREAGLATPNKLSVILESGGSQRYTDGGAEANGLTSTTSVGLSTAWQHVLLVRSGTTCTMYIDGASETSGTNASFASMDNAGNFFLGARSDLDANRLYGGDLAEWAKWDRALSASERAGLAGGKSPMFYRPAWYVPMQGPYQELIAGLTVSNTGSVVSAHPPIIYPTAPIIVTRNTAAAAGRIMGSLAGHGGLAGPGGLAGERGGLAA